MHSAGSEVKGFSGLIASIGHSSTHRPHSVQFSPTRRWKAAALEISPSSAPNGQRYLHQKRGANKFSVRMARRGKAITSPLTGKTGRTFNTRTSKKRIRIVMGSKLPNKETFATAENSNAPRSTYLALRHQGGGFRPFRGDGKMSRRVPTGHTHPHHTRPTSKVMSKVRRARGSITVREARPVIRATRGSTRKNRFTGRALLNRGVVRAKRVRNPVRLTY